MDRSKRNLQKKITIESEIQKAFGFHDDQLIREFDKASEMQDPELQPPVNEYLKILLRIEQNEKDPSEKEAATSKKMIRLERFIKVVMTVAVLVGVLMATGITAMTRGALDYKSRDIGGGKVVVNNDDYKDDPGKLINAYEEISKETGIRPLKMTYIPADTKFKSLDIVKGHAFLELEHENSIIQFVQMLSPIVSSSSYSSDRVEGLDVYNVWLDMTLKVVEKDVNGKKEYSTTIEIDNAYYYISGSIEKDVFQEIVEGLSF